MVSAANEHRPVHGGYPAPTLLGPCGVAVPDTMVAVMMAQGIARQPAHPDPEIAAELEEEAQESERVDVAAGYAPRRWRCDCGAEHSRGHFFEIGTHRCLACGYVGQGGTLLSPAAGEFPV